MSGHPAMDAGIHPVGATNGLRFTKLTGMRRYHRRSGLATGPAAQRK